MKTFHFSAPETTLAFQLKHATPFIVVTQYKFHPVRKFRADFAVWASDASKDNGVPPLLVEIDGAKRGIPGAHQRVDGIDRDCRKVAEAMLLGYRLLRVSSGMVRDGTALQYIEQLVVLQTGLQDAK